MTDDCYSKTDATHHNGIIPYRPGATLRQREQACLTSWDDLPALAGEDTIAEHRRVVAHDWSPFGLPPLPLPLPPLRPLPAMDRGPRRLQPVRQIELDAGRSYYWSFVGKRWERKRTVPAWRRALTQVHATGKALGVVAGGFALVAGVTWLATALLGGPGLLLVVLLVVALWAGSLG